jgi:hypothetical protein
MNPFTATKEAPWSAVDAAEWGGDSAGQRLFTCCDRSICSGLTEGNAMEYFAVALIAYLTVCFICFGALFGAGGTKPD